MTGAKLKMDDRFTDVHGEWQVLSVHPPHGRRRYRMYTILNLQTSIAEMVPEPDLFAKENDIRVHED